MAFLAKLKPSEFKPLAAGTHLAICDAVVAGLQKTKFGNKDTLYLRFEVPAERFESTRDGEEVDEPGTIWARYNNNLHEKAKLRQHLEAWRGEDFTPQEEVDGFDLTTLLGKPCVISVKHSQNGDKTYANVDTVAKIMKGQEIPPQELKSICFGPDDTDQWEGLPEFLQKNYDSRVMLAEPDPPAHTYQCRKHAKPVHVRELQPLPESRQTAVFDFARKGLKGQMLQFERVWKNRLQENNTPSTIILSDGKNGFPRVTQLSIPYHYSTLGQVSRLRIIGLVETRVVDHW